MHVDSAGHVGVSLAGHHPAGTVEGVPVALVVTGNEVHHHHVIGQVVQAVQPDLERREHPPAKTDMSGSVETF